MAKICNTQRAVVEALFRRLGLAGTLVRAELVTDSPEARRLISRLERYENNHETEKADAILSQVRILVSAEIRCNRQTLMRKEINIQRGRQEIGGEAYCRRMQETLELTLPFGNSQ